MKDFPREFTQREFHLLFAWLHFAAGLTTILVAILFVVLHAIAAGYHKRHADAPAVD